MLFSSDFSWLKRNWLVIAVMAGCVLFSQLIALLVTLFFNSHSSRFLFLIAFMEPFLAAPAPVIAYILLSDYLKRKNRELKEISDELSDSLNKAKELRTLLPVCVLCKKIRVDQDYWDKIEQFVSKRTNAQFSHGVCPECLKKQMADIDQGRAHEAA